MKIQRILLPMDLREGSTSIAHQAATLAHHFNSEILMLHVVTPLSYSAGLLEGEFVPVNIADLEAELIRSAEARLDRILAPELGGLGERSTRGFLPILPPLWRP